MLPLEGNLTLTSCPSIKFIIIMASASGLYELPTILHLLQLTLMQMISKEILLIILLHHTWVLGWLQRIHNTFLRYLRDASKSVCCSALVQRTRKMKSPVATPKPTTCLFMSCP